MAIFKLKKDELVHQWYRDYYKVEADTIEEAVERSALVLDEFVSAGIDVIRIGLCSSDNLCSRDTYFDGPNHPALGELVQNELYYIKIKKELSKNLILNNSIIQVFVPKGAISKSCGQKRKNKIRLLNDFSIKDVIFTEDEALLPYNVYIRIENGDTKCT